MTGKRKQGLRVYGNQQKRRSAQWSGFLNEPEDKMVHSLPVPGNSTLAPPLPKKRPLSQKEATMPAEPDPAHVDMVVEFTSCSRKDAIRFLKVKNNNIEAAATAIIDGENIDSLEQGTTWDEAMFSSDRDGNDVRLHPLGTSPAPTRGPSPAPSLGASHPKSKTQEEQDIETAIARSQQTQDLPYQQETGVRLQDGTETGQKFGPATREHYERDQWALILPTSAVADEVVPDVEVEQRHNVNHEPRLLKHLPDGDYTPNFITICHAIPTAREGFLLRDHVRADYGEDGDWWRGHPIPISRIVHTVDGSPTQPDSDARDELLAETQRLMAFLDGSDRSYASIGGLTQTEAIKNGETDPTDAGTLLELFIKQWTAAAFPRSQYAQTVARLFTTQVGTTASTGLPNPYMSVVDLAVSTREGEAIDLSELLDNLLWTTDPDDQDMTYHYIKSPAEIVVMRLSHTDPAATRLGVYVPAMISLDKYLEENAKTTGSMRTAMVQIKKRIRKLEEMERRVKYRQHPNDPDRQIEARELLQYTHGHYTGRNRLDLDKADNSNNASTAATQPPHYPDVVQKLERAMASIDEKLKTLALEKEKARKSLGEISKSTSADLGLGQPTRCYTLRGVATKPNITYVLRPKDTDDSEDMLVQSDEESTPPDMQWWRLDYEVTETTARIIKSKAADYDVLRAVELEHSGALLVYASELACGLEFEPDLPEPLQDFLRRDNDLFLSEIQASQRRQQHQRRASSPPAYDDIAGPAAAASYPDVPRESIERASSMDSTRVEAGADSSPPSPSPPGYEDVGFEAHPDFGLGYDVKHLPGATAMDQSATARVSQVEDIEVDPPVAEINLSPPRRENPFEDEEDRDLLGSMRETELEMVQKAHTPLFPVSGDAQMRDTEGKHSGGGGEGSQEDVDMR